MPSHVGRYRLLMPIAQGGMAEIFLARQEGPQGFQKDVTVKRVLPQFASDGDFVEMFLDEARLAAKLSHPNVVQVFDFGEDQGSYFLAMEYLSGEDLSHVLRLLKKRDEPMPFDVVASIVADAAAGLHHAHTLANDAGEPLHIVHRDVSPSNIFLTYQGMVKVLDFGIAKAEGKVLKTKTGVLKGKHLYMSPEQIRAEPLTAQSDVFALGACMYEMLTGKRPFQRDNEIAVLQAILVDPVQHPSAYRPDLPAHLDDVVMRCLERELDKRLKSADELRAALRETVGSGGGVDQVRSYMRHLFGPDAAKQKLAQLLPPEEVPTVRLDSGPRVLKETLATVDPVVERKAAAPSSSRAPAIALGVVAAAAIGIGAWQWSRGEAAAPPPAQAAPVAAPAPAVIVEEAAPPPPPPDAVAPVPAAPPAPVVVEEPPPERRAARDRTKRASSAKSSPARAPSPASSSAAEPGFLTVNCIPWCRIYVDDEDTGKNSPLRALPLAPGKHVLKVVNPPTGKSEQRPVVITAGETVQQIVRF